MKKIGKSSQNKISGYGKSKSRGADGGDGLSRGTPVTGLVVLNERNSPVVEQYRILFSKLDDICQADGKRMIAVTSASYQEGKTTTVSNLAVIAARDFGKRCLLIDTHAKKPMVAETFNLEHGMGLMDLIAKRCAIAESFARGPVHNLTLLPMGETPDPSAATLNIAALKEVFTKARREDYSMLWDEDRDDFLQTGEEEAELFDYIFIDAPPLCLPDTNRILGAVDAILLVVGAGTVPQKTLTKAIRQLDASKIIGSVLNRAKSSLAAA